MSIFKPRYRFVNILEITPENIKNSGAKAVLVDADNTLSLHGSQEPYPGVPEWIRKTVGSGIPVIIISNNNRGRIAPFAERLGVPYIEKSAKPLPNGFLRACKRLGIKPKEAAVIGDQIFTDVVGGNLIGAVVFLTAPLGPDTDKFIKAKRRLEKFVR
ncbi:MAG: YqeG family HAD IIIA-type phosphatase [Oscillospiraceae bacterium]